MCSFAWTVIALFRTGTEDDPLMELFSIFLDWLHDRLIPFPTSMKLQDDLCSHGSSTKACFILELDTASFVAFAYAPGSDFHVSR